MSSPKFVPVFVAVEPRREILYEPEGQEALSPGDRLVYVLIPPSKGTLEKVQNTEIEMVIDSSNTTGEQTGKINTGTARRLYMVNCLRGWRNLFSKNPDGGYSEVEFKQPAGQPGSSIYENDMMANIERIPEDHISAMIRLLKSTSRVTDAVTVEKN